MKIININTEKSCSELLKAAIRGSKRIGELESYLLVVKVITIINISEKGLKRLGMKILWNDKDGGQDSLVWAWGLESKRFGSIILLNFKRGSREAYHNHAFNAISWLLKGKLLEQVKVGKHLTHSINYIPRWKPILTSKDRFHKVSGMADNSWALSIRGRWDETWLEDNEHGLQTLTNGRKVVESNLLDRDNEQISEDLTGSLITKIEGNVL